MLHTGGRGSPNDYSLEIAVEPTDAAHRGLSQEALIRGECEPQIPRSVHYKHSSLSNSKAEK